MSRHHSSAHSYDRVTVHATPHWDPQVRAAGFPLEHPYIDRCWGAALGPTSVLVLRRASELWAQDLSPILDVEDLSRIVGLGKATGANGPLWRSIARLERFGFAKADGPGQICIYTEAPPLDRAALGRLPEWTRDQHYRLLDAHLDRLAGRSEPDRAPSPAAFDQLMEHAGRARRVPQTTPHNHVGRRAPSRPPVRADSVDRPATQLEL